ncbi:replication-relaxation family protein [Enterococcus faecalis]|uniref:replication-relaxation family protein n=1 Tax=Enterococcus faecalis TaxID=1351 RepID=UPI001F064E0B|nr:replication-relaxation family protein [Enterococcus faecalis]MCH1672945.1 replication-relaxation family protein [Enterococcus faecalis]
MNLVLTERDQRVLGLCHDYVYADGSYLKETVFSEPNQALTEAQNRYANRRLAELIKGGYLARFLRVDTNYHARDTIYTLGKKGEAYIRAERGLSDYQAKWRKSLKVWYNHALTTMRVTESLRVQFANNPAYQFIEYVPESRAFFKYGDSPKDVIRPDGLIVLGVRDEPKETLCFLLEIENSVSQYRVIKEKLKRYGDFLQSSVKQKKYDDRVAFAQPIAQFVPLFISSTKREIQPIVDKMARFKAEDENQNLVLFQNFLLATTQEEIEQNATAPIYYDLSQEDISQKITLFGS